MTLELMTRVWYRGHGDDRAKQVIDSTRSVPVLSTHALAVRRKEIWIETVIFSRRHQSLSSSSLPEIEWTPSWNQLRLSDAPTPGDTGSHHRWPSPVNGPALWLAGRTGDWPTDRCFNGRSANYSAWLYTVDHFQWTAVTSTDCAAEDQRKSENIRVVNFTAFV